MSKTVVLIHGFMNTGLSMKYLEKKLIPLGYTTYCFSYNSPKYSKQTLADLDALISTIHAEDLYLIGHSMGGLVIRNYLNTFKHRASRIKGVVTIGTPHNQSKCAHNLSKSMFKPLFGTAGSSGLTTTIPDWSPDVPIGCIAGVAKNNWSTNWFIWKERNFAPNDGTIFVDEAILPVCTDKIVVPGGHTALLMNKEVARQCHYFIKNKCFSHSA